MSTIAWETIPNDEERDDTNCGRERVEEKEVEPDLLQRQ